MVEKVEYYEVETTLGPSQRSASAVPRRNLGGSPLVWPVVGLLAGGLGGLAVYMVILALALDISGIFALGSLAPLCIPVGASFGLAGVTLRRIRWAK